MDKSSEFNRDLVYFGKIKTVGDGTELITIGWTGDIQYETNCLVREFGSMSILNTFVCSDNIRFKTFLHRHEVLYGCQYTKPVNNKKYSCRVFRMNPRNVEDITRVAINSVGAFRTFIDQHPDNPRGFLEYQDPIPEPDDTEYVEPESDAEST